MSLHESATLLAQHGFYVFPLVPGSKLPAIKEFANRCTRDPGEISKWWAQNPEYNIGIYTGKFKDNEALIVIDVDNKEGKNGDATIDKLYDEGSRLLPTFTQTTPTGGLHFVYRYETAVVQGAGVLGPGVDTRSAGGYIVGAGSIIGGKKYYVSDAGDVERCPEWVLKFCRPKEASKKKESKTKIKANQVQAIKRSVEYLQSLPAAEEGERNDKGYKVACQLKDFGVNKDLCLELMETAWKCEPSLDIDELSQLVKSAYDHGINPPGVDAPEADFTSTVDENKSFLERMNDEYALVFGDGAKFYIIHETKDAFGNRTRNRLTKETFKEKFATRIVEKKQTEADLWLKWSKRRTYNGVVFAPEVKISAEFLNLWDGFSVSPKSYSDASPQARLGFDMFKEHVDVNVCGGDAALAKWLWGYFAHLIQRPFERPLTALVFQGQKGVGKNTLIDCVGKLFSSNQYVVANNPRYLSSNFNSYVEQGLLMVLDEAFWSGDKSAEGQLKGYITSREVMIERKGLDPYKAKNLMRIVILGNEDWLVPASGDERRYAVFKLGEKRKQDTKWFSTLRELMEDCGGCSVLLQYLRDFPLSEVNVNVAPVTEGLIEQKIESMSPTERWWGECLSEEKLFGQDFDGPWPEEISISLLVSSATSFYKSIGIHKFLPSKQSIAKRVRAFCPQVRYVSVRDDKGRRTKSVYTFPPVAECISAFEKFKGFKIEELGKREK